MERYGRRKVYCIRLRKTNMVFPSLASFLFHMSTIYCYFLSFSSASHLSLTLAQTFCDKEKEEETVECLGNEKKTVFMVRREERNKFSPCPLWRQKKTFSSPSIRPSSPSFFAQSADERRWRHGGSKWITNMRPLCRATVHFLRFCLSGSASCACA